MCHFDTRIVKHHPTVGGWEGGQATPFPARSLRYLASAPPPPPPKKNPMAMPLGAVTMVTKTHAWEPVLYVFTKFLQTFGCLKLDFLIVACSIHIHNYFQAVAIILHVHVYIITASREKKWNIGILEYKKQKVNGKNRDNKGEAKHERELKEGNKL